MFIIFFHIIDQKGLKGRGLRCESGITIFAWRFTSNYADSPIKLENLKNKVKFIVVKKLYTL